jgi:hypothetical protein
MRRPWQSSADCDFEIAASDRPRTGLRWSDHRLVTAVSHATLRAVAVDPPVGVAAYQRN